MAGIKDYSTTQANNTSLNGINTAEGMLPSDLNNAIRALMKNTREWYNDAQWVIYGDGDAAFTSAYVSGTSFTINGVDVTAFYHAGRRVKITGSSTGTVFGTISSSSFSTNTIVNLTLDSGALQNEALVIYLAILTQTNNSIPTDVIDSGNLKNNSITTAKINSDAVTTAKIPDNAITTAKINADAVNGTKIADDSIDSEHLVDGSVDTAHIADSNITTAKIADSNVTTAKIADDAVTIGKIADAAIVISSEQAAHTPNDTTFYTTSAADTRFLNKDTSELINSGQSWSNSDDFIATTAAINARVIDLVDDVGGFFPIANETSFPNTNPDINDGAGTIVSIQAISSTRTPSGGTVSISSGTVGGSTVTITGCGSTVLTAGFGVLVETTTTLNTYTFHRLTPKATEVSTVAANATAISNVNSNSSNINTVAGNSTNINTVAANNTNVTNVGGSIANVNTLAANITGVNSFAERYRVSSSNPTSSLDSGDLAFVTGDSNLKFYNGSSWVAISPGIANVVDDSSPQLGGNLDLNSNDITGTGGIPSANLTGTINDGRLPTNISNKTLTGATITTVYNGLTAGGDGGSNDGQITLNCSQNSHGVKIKAPPHSAAQSYTLTLPSSITNNYFLKTDGSGNLSFAEVPQPTVPTVADVSQTIAPATATTISITGTNFVSIPQVQFVNSSTGAITNSNTVSFTNATTLSVNVTLASGNYFVRVENPDGNAGRSTNNILTASTAPSFSTAAGSLGTIAGNFSGTVATVAGSSDSAITFSETTNVLTNASQANCSLNGSTGAITTTDFGGSSTTPTTYNFTLKITDAEGQFVTRDFSLQSSFGATGGGQFN